MDTYIILDIGGTNIRCAVFPSNQQKPLRIKKIKTHAEGESPLNRIMGIIEELWLKDYRVLGISAAAPGSIDIQSGTVLLAPNIEGWSNIPLCESLGTRFKVKTLVNNDARLAAYGEWKCGAGRGFDNIIFLTISTGVGGGIITDGKLLQGQIGIATELGHMTILADGPVCSCGKKGHLEALSSGPAIEKFVRNQIAEGSATVLSNLPDFHTPDIAQAAKNGDELAKKAFELAGYYLGIGVASYMHIFNPSCIIFGGGVMQSGDLLSIPFRRSLEKHVLNKRYLEGVKIASAELGDDAGLIGALEYIKDQG